MKALTTVLLTLTLVSCNYFEMTFATWDDLYPKAKSYDFKEFTSTIESFDSISEMHSWVWSNVKYVEDTKDSLFVTNDDWKSPIETLRDGGDCEDFAVLKAVILEKYFDKKVEVIILNFNERNFYHAVIGYDGIMKDSTTPGTFTGTDEAIVAKVLTTNEALDVCYNGIWRGIQ